MRRAILVTAIGFLAFPATASAISTKLRAFSPLEDRPGTVFRRGDPVQIVANGFAPDLVCGKAEFTLTDAAGKKFHLGDAHPGFGQWGEGFIHRQVGSIPPAAAFGSGLIDSNQTCKNIGHVRGKAKVRILDPGQAMPVISAVSARDALSGGTSKLSFRLDRYAEVSVVVQYEFVAGDWRTVDVAADRSYFDDAGTQTIDWKADAGGSIPPGHYRYLLRPRAPTVGDGVTVTQDFGIARRIAAGIAGPAGMVLAPGGTLVVAERAGARVGSFTLGGALTGVDSFNLLAPVDVALLPDAPSSTLIADATSHRILRHDRTAAGTTATLFAGPLSSGPTGVAATSLDGGRVFFVDGATPQVYVSTLAGNPQAPIHATGLVAPADVAVALDGTLWVADAGASRLLHVTPAGAVLASVVIAGGLPVQGRRAKAQLAGIDVDFLGRVTFTSTAPIRVGSAVGSTVQLVGAGLLQQPSGIVSIGRSGDLVVADTKAGTLLQYRIP